MASNVTRDNLKGYFNTGDQPTESNFADLIESNLNLTDDSTVAGATTFSKQITASAGVNGAGTGIMQGTLKQIVTTGPSADISEDVTLHVSHSGATIVVSASLDLKLPTPVAGLNYKFVAQAAVATTGFTLTATTDGSSAENLFSGLLVDNNGDTNQKVDLDVLTFTTAATEGDFCEVTCMGTGTTSGDPTWNVFCLADADDAITIA